MLDNYLKPKVELKRLTHKEVKALSKNDIIEYIDGKRGNLTISTYQLLIAELTNREHKTQTRINLFFGFVAAVTGVISVLSIVLAWF